jgi:hypothetical protein
MLSIYEGIVAVGKLTGGKRVDIREVRLRLIPLEFDALEQYGMDNGWLKCTVPARLKNIVDVDTTLAMVLPESQPQVPVKKRI